MMKPRLQTMGKRVALLPRYSNKLYSSESWRNLVKRLRTERGYQCEECGNEKGRIYADHIKELRDGGAELDPANVQLLCASCHTKKTNRARAARATKRWG